MAGIQRTYRISEIVEEAPKVKTFFFKYPKPARPGQFVMTWVPSAEEVPMSVSYSGGGNLGITVFSIGPTTNKLNSLKVGDYVGLRGPYGNSFKLKGDTIALIAGGTGAAPLSFFAESLLNEDIKVHALLGARSKNHLIFKKRFEEMPYVDVHCATDDGSYGHKGFVTEIFETLLKREKFDQVYTCGPPAMIQKVFEICKREKIGLQASLESYMKCGIGLCGSCALGPYLVCKDGPVFNLKQLKKIYKNDN